MLVKLLFEFIPAWFDEHGTIGENNCGYTAIAVIDLHYEFCGFVIPLKPYVEKWNIVSFEEFLGTEAV